MENCKEGKTPIPTLWSFCLLIRTRLLVQRSETPRARKGSLINPRDDFLPVTSAPPNLLFAFHVDLWNLPVLQNLARGCSPVTELSQLIQKQGELMLVKIELIFSGAGTFNGPLPHKRESTLTKQNWQIGRCQGFQGMGRGSLWSVPEGEKSRPNFLSS